MISSVRSGSLGEYGCLAKNKFGSDSVLLTVVDERKIIVTEPPQHQGQCWAWLDHQSGAVEVPDSLKDTVGSLCC